MPIVSVPLLLAIFGFRSTSKAVLIGMGAGFITVMFFKLLSDTDSLMPGMLVNLIFFISSHYCLKQSGGWVGVKDNKPLLVLRAERVKKIDTIIRKFKAFNFLKFCKSNLPKEEKLLVYFGLFCIVSVISNAYSLSIDTHNQYATTIEGIYYYVLITSTIFITYSFWSERFKNKALISVLWNITVFFNLAFSSSLFVIFSKFSSIQIAILMANLITIAVLMRWQAAMFIIVSGAVTSTWFYKSYTSDGYLPSSMDNLQFKIVYVLLLVSSILIAFLKPKQEYQELTEEKVGHLTGRIDSQEKQVQEAEALKSEFIRNVAHEYHAPMTGVMSMAENLYAAYDKLNDRQRKEAVEIIYKSAIRLDSYDTNLTTLSKLSQAGYDLKLEQVDLSSLIYDQVQICRRLYEEDKEDREFVLDIEEGIIVNGDKGYLVQLLDNLIINAIKYCKKGKITASLKQTAKGVHFALSDEGIGIPKSELYNIFNPFAVSSKTRTSAGGRGVGLALCKRIVEIHEGKIWAESNGEKGTVFIVELPL
jgi:signal transduction histidine kinase